ncbi:TPA: acylneuraminate cytidylyltransferase family protein [Legionella pneumophila]|nr:acylneuraminate cytidylyltransferase family protein [Legionella pneumophila]RYW22371.1 acylneuraminate cytidylyltransferase family protein [Legionella pneumophila]HAT7770228.1 acylneuraminate cytidylyltransferase family protein [Legionella pneumophila]HAT8585280.1 acylneuraminate cytidylyltransferase family protein [Legionella pneumophila]HAU1171763.1 acylneuraminate cytidylyltransferase family protein [Legionella pneumophila]
MVIKYQGHELINHCDKPNILAIIPARGGSKRLPRKNILNLRGKPLLVHTILAARHCDLITDVVVSTEDDLISNVAFGAGAKVIDRPLELAGDTISNEHVIKHVIKTFSETSYFPDYIVLLQPTSPLRTAFHLKQCLEQYLASEMKSVISVCKVEHHPGKCIRIKDNQALPYTCLDDVERRTQDLEEVYRQNGAIYALKTTDFLEQLKFYQSPCLPYVMSMEDSIDVDNKLDLQFCEFLLSEKEKHDKVNNHVC